MRTLALLWSTLALLTACGDDLQPAPPPTIADATLTTAEDTPASVALVASDVLGRALTYQASAPAHGTVSLTGASLSFTPEADYHGPDQVTVSVGVDGDDARSSAVVTITVTPVNDAPVAGADALAADEDTAAEVATAALLGNDTDVDGDSLTVTAVGPVDQGAGTVSLSSDGLGLTFTPAADFTGAATFPYSVSDGAASATATVTVTVGGRNDAPVAGADSLTTAEDVELVVLPAVLLGNDTDPDGQALSVSAVGPVTGGGTVSLSGGMVRFVPARDFAGVVTFPYTLTDGADTATGVVTVTVTAVDDAPVAGDDSTSTLEDTPLVLGVFALLGNDTDLDGPTLGVSAVGPATGGTVALTGTTITFTPSPDSSGPAGFDYTISDGTLTDTGRVNVLVVAANDRPVAGDDSATVPGDTTLTLAAADLLGNDTDVDGPALRVSAVGPATDGVVALAGTTITFTPALGFVGIAGFDYQVSDGDLTDTGHVTVVVTDVDTTPIAVDDGPVSTTEDNAVIIPVLGNDGGLGDPPLVVTIVTPPGAGSAIVLPDLTVRYQPAAEASGTDTFSYEVRDVDGQASTALVTVEVSPVDDPPTVADQSLPSADGAGVLVTLVAADVDSASVTFAVATGPSHGTLGAVTPTGPLTATVGYTPSAGYVGVDTFTVTAADASSSSAPATITLTMTMSAPTVSATTPADGASAVDPLAPLALTFSLAMDPTSLTVQGAAGPCSGAIQLSADDFASCLGLGSAAAMSAGDTVATVTPAPALAHGTSYKLRVTGAALTATGTAMAATFTQATGFSTRTSAPCATDLVISQIYAGGGNSGALFNNDFIELHNPTPAPIDLTGYAVQFTSATGTTWAAQALPAVSLPAGGYYLIQEAAGTGTPEAAADARLRAGAAVRDGRGLRQGRADPDHRGAGRGLPDVGGDRRPGRLRRHRVVLRGRRSDPGAQQQHGGPSRWRRLHRCRQRRDRLRDRAAGATHRRQRAAGVRVCRQRVRPRGRARLLQPAAPAQHHGRRREPDRAPVRSGVRRRRDPAGRSEHPARRARAGAAHGQPAEPGRLRVDRGRVQPPGRQRRRVPGPAGRAAGERDLPLRRPVLARRRQLDLLRPRRGWRGPRPRVRPGPARHVDRAVRPGPGRPATAPRQGSPQDLTPGPSAFRVQAMATLVGQVFGATVLGAAAAAGLRCRRLRRQEAEVPQLRRRQGLQGRPGLLQQEVRAVRRG